MTKWKSPNNTRVNLYLPNVVVYALEQRAKKAGLKTVGEYIKAQLLKACNYQD